ncbi:MAG: hypothetical protein EHM30_05150 [Desulfobacteraceae bacterium]|nr:MAG: hypothetical protein EHM30_05150 [Desulfobacteraceae bacterium]
MNIKICLIIIASTFGLMIAGAVIVNILESNGTLKTLSPEGIAAIKWTYFILFCIMGFCLVPVVIRYFIFAQIKIGNGGHSLIKWLQASEQTVIYGFWCLFVIGLSIGLPVAVKQGFFK